MPNMTSPAAYPIYLLSGMAAWGLFTEILTRSMNVFIEQASALKKISFPRLCLPIIVWGSAISWNAAIVWGSDLLTSGSTLDPSTTFWGSLATVNTNGQTFTWGSTDPPAAARP